MTAISPKPPIKVLLADTDIKTAESIRTFLASEAFELVHTRFAGECIELVKLIMPDIILLELDYEEMDGVELCLKIRSEKLSKNPFIVFYTSQEGNFAQIASLNAGADDYVLKGISKPLFKSKIESWVRRIFFDINSQNNGFQSNIRLNKDRLSVFSNQQEIYLTKKEFDILYLIVSNPKKVFSRDDIKAYAWKNQTSVRDRTVDVHIRQLRVKIGDNIINTIKGKGYTFSEFQLT